MKSRNYIVNKKKLSSAETEKFKDFDSVMDKVNSNPNPGGGDGGHHRRHRYDPDACGGW